MSTFFARLFFFLRFCGPDLRFSDDDLDSSLTQLFHVSGVDAGIGVQSGDVTDGADIGEGLTSKLAVVREGNSRLGGTGNGFFDLGFAVIRSRNAIFRIDRVYSEDRLVEAYFRQSTLRPLAREIKRIF